MKIKLLTLIAALAVCVGLFAACSKPTAAITAYAGDYSAGVVLLSATETEDEEADADAEDEEEPAAPAATPAVGAGWSNFTKHMENNWYWYVLGGVCFLVLVTLGKTVFGKK